jgi:threonine aldolase
MLQDGAWLRHARHANEMAKRLEARLRKIPGVLIAHPVQSNAVFAKIPKTAEEKLRERGWQFSTGGVTPGDSRFMCSWDTTPGEVDGFVTELQEIIR